MFDKYDRMGAYHWRECNRGSKDYNPPLVARYVMIMRRVRTGGRALDLGAGDGYLSDQLAAVCETVVALDYEATGVALAAEMLCGFGNVTVRRGDTYALPFEDDSFDTVAMADVIEHLHRPKQALAEMARVLRPGGTAFVTTPQWRPDRVWDVRHVKEYTARELSDLMGASFGSVDMHFAWPRPWSDFYRTPVGWHLLKFVGRMGLNPFTRESRIPEGFCQMLAICTKPGQRSG